MGTKRLYIGNRVAPYSPTSFKGTWYTTAGSSANLLEPVPPGVSGGLNGGRNGKTTVSGQRYAFGKSVSYALKAGTLSGTFNLALGIQNKWGTTDTRLAFHIWVTVGNSSTVRGTAYADGMGTVDVNSYTYSINNIGGAGIGGSVTLTDVAVQAGDRVVIEIGFHGLGTDSGMVSNVGTSDIDMGADIVVGEGYTSSVHAVGQSWVEFSDTGDVFDEVSAYPPFRHYLTGTDAAVVPATAKGSWDQTGSSVAKVLATTPAGSGTTVAISETSTTNAWDVLLGRWISAPMTAPATTAGCYLLGVGQVKESASAANMFHHVHAYVTVGDTDAVRGTLITDSVNSVEAPTSNFIASSTVLATRQPPSFPVFPGDRVVVEQGVRANNTSATSYTGTLYYGGSKASGVYDLDSVNATSTGPSPWIDLRGFEKMFGTASQGGISEGAASSSGTADVVTGSVTHDAAGTGDGVAASSGALSTSSTVDGTSAGISSSSGSPQLEVFASGTSASAASSSGAASATRAVDGSAAGTQTSSGAVSLAKEVAGTSAGAGAAAGTLSVSGADGESTTEGVGVSTGSLSVSLVASGASAGLATSTATQVLVRTLDGSSSGLQASTGSQTLGVAAAGSSAGAGTSTGALSKVYDLDGSTTGAGATAGSVSAGSDLLGETFGTSSSSGVLGVERNLAGVSGGEGATSSVLARVVELLGASAGLGGSDVTVTAVYDATGITAAYQSSTATLTLRTPLLATSDLVVTTWLKTATGLDPSKVATTLPENVEDWGEVGFIQARTVGGRPDIDLPVQRPVVQIDVWAVKPGTGRPLWNVANVLAMRVLEATRDELDMRRELVLPTGYPRAHVLECYPLTEPYRVESDPGGYARFRFDIQFHWVARP